MEHAQETFVEYSSPDDAQVALDDVWKLFLANRLAEATLAGTHYWIAPISCRWP